MILEYLDDEGDFCVLGDDEQSFQEMLDCIQVTGSADSICYRLNLKITAAPPSPVEELPSSISSRPNRATGAGHSRKKIRFCWRWYTATRWAHTSIFEEEPPSNDCIKPVRVVCYFPTGTNKTSNSKGWGYTKKDRRLRRWMHFDSLDKFPPSLQQMSSFKFPLSRGRTVAFFLCCAICRVICCPTNMSQHLHHGSLGGCTCGT